MNAVRVDRSATPRRLHETGTERKKRKSGYAVALIARASGAKTKTIQRRKQGGKQITDPRRAGLNAIEQRQAVGAEVAVERGAVQQKALDDGERVGRRRTVGDGESLKAQRQAVKAYSSQEGN